MLDGLDTQTSLIYQPIVEELAQVEERLHHLSDVGTAYLPELLDYVFRTGGKRVRPAITLLAARFHPSDNSHPLIMAAAVELLHMATLIHDDTVDNSPLRRGKATVSGLWGKNVAVLLGDFVFATSAVFVCDTNNIRVIRRFSETLMDLSSGELLEYFNSNNWQQSREDYYDRIYRKTASLFDTSAESGAILSGAPEDTVQSLKAYGYNIGMAFQIIDDILDMEGDAEEIGKPVGNDLLQGVLTLPAIICIERSPTGNPIETLFSSKPIEPNQDLSKALKMIQDLEIIEACYSVARTYCTKAKESLDPLPDNPAKRSLIELSSYVMDRTH